MVFPLEIRSNFTDPFGLCPQPPCRSSDDPLKDRDLPPGVDKGEITWDPNIQGYRGDKDGRIIKPHPEDRGHWDHWDIIEPASGGKKHRQTTYPENSRKVPPGQAWPRGWSVNVRSVASATGAQRYIGCRLGAQSDELESSIAAVSNHAGITRPSSAHSAADSHTVGAIKMLRLRLAKKTPWRDSKDVLRSPFEEFTLLTERARSQLGGDHAHDFVPWEIGVMTDDWDAPPWSKPRSINEEHEGGPNVRAVGSERAAELSCDLVPLWKRFFSWLVPTSGLTLLVSDEIWDQRGMWLPIGAAMSVGLLGGRIPSVEPTAKPNLYYGRARPREIETLIDAWWPSGVGVFSGFVFRGSLPRDAAEAIARNASLTITDLSHLTTYFRTSPSFDNLGFSVLSREVSWDGLRKRLESNGWSSGAPIDFLLGPEEE